MTSTPIYGLPPVPDDGNFCICTRNRLHRIIPCLFHALEEGCRGETCPVFMKMKERIGGRAE